MSYSQAQRHNPLRPYMDSSDSLPQTFPSSSGGTNTPLSSASESEELAGGGGSSSRAIGGIHRGGQQSEKGKEQHEIYMGGTGMQRLKEPKAIVRKRVTIMIICGLVIAAIITIAILGVKKLL
ncbi:uncharacterized protein JCM6883_002524 [Sporobolomyces salmoneus]|uniref:uncharacterized protein n=1 Tax=Sporobolomyces salmoneus TaxID=183962 RepID=UPI00317FE6DE